MSKGDDILACLWSQEFHMIRVVFLFCQRYKSIITHDALSVYFA